ncbi:MAG: hypothetical protein JW785_09580 [Acidimicrobiia bacterium]|nr:hypothetical protein [Acidimicrobiia bacterium]
MPEGKGEEERSGPVLRIAALLAALLALTAVIAPRVAFSDGAEGAASSPSPAVPATPAAPDPGTTTAATAGVVLSGDDDDRPPCGTLDSGGTPTTSAPAATGGTVTETDEGEVTLTLAGLHAGREGPRRGSFFPDDRIGWHFQVANTGGEYLWGVFVYLELYGPVVCNARRLAVGEAADCWAETWAQPGSNDAEAWVTAWTTSRMVFSRVSHRIVVAAA